MNLTGKVAIVTGAGKGIGKATSLALAEAGAIVVLAGIRDESIEEVRSEIAKKGGQAMTVRTDVSKWEDTARTAKATLDKYGRIDILVNNAGVDKIDKDGRQFTIADMEDADWDMVLGVNLKGQFHYTPREHIEMAAKMVPLRRVAEASDVAHVILFFCSEPLLVTGQTLVVDGGGTMH